MKQGTHHKKTHRALHRLPTFGRFNSVQIEALETLWQACGNPVPSDRLCHMSDGTWASRPAAANVVSDLRAILGKDAIRNAWTKGDKGRRALAGYVGAEDLYDRVKSVRNRDRAPDPKTLAEALRQLADMVSPL